jgi:hypothetical protein
MTEPLPEFVAEQIAALEIDRERPLVLSDADEVLVQFARPLETFLDEQGLYLDLRSFRLTGNVKMKGSHEVIGDQIVMALLAEFFASRVADFPAVPGATRALAQLSRRAQIIVVSNVPKDSRQARADSLHALGMPYPLIANEGEKGPAVREIVARHAAPVVFLDDLPQNIASVAIHAAHVHRIHFIADPRLRPLLDPAKDAHARIDEWPAALAHIEEHFQSHGFGEEFGHGDEG